MYRAAQSNYSLDASELVELFKLAPIEEIDYKVLPNPSIYGQKEYPFLRSRVS